MQGKEPNTCQANAESGNTLPATQALSRWAIYTAVSRISAAGDMITLQLLLVRMRLWQGTGAISPMIACFEQLHHLVVQRWST